MKVNIMPCRFPLKPNEWPLLLKEGVERSGDSAAISQEINGADVHVFWGLRRPWGRQAIRLGKRSIIIERAYLGNRFKWLAFGLDGLNGKANFCNENVPADRWEKYWQAEMKPWRESKGQYALVIGQVPGDASLGGIDIFKWILEIIPKAKKQYGQVVFRPHPQAKNKHRFKIFWAKYQKYLKGVRIDNGDLQTSIAGAEIVITYTSNVAVDSIMAGVPAISFNRGSMAWEVTSHELGAPYYKGDREDWGRKIAYAQWLPEELRDGTAWSRIKEFV